MSETARSHASAAASVAEIHQSLRQLHPSPSWAYFAELRTTTGFAGLEDVRSLDGFAMGIWPSLKFKRVAYEIKVSRADWLRELQRPRKRQQAYLLAHEFWFAVAPGVVAVGEAKPWGPGVTSPDWTGPDGYEIEGCGVLEVSPNGPNKVLRPARRHSAWPMPDHFIASLLRRAGDGETPPPEGVPGRQPLWRQMDASW